MSGIAGEWRVATNRQVDCVILLLLMVISSSDLATGVCAQAGDKMSTNPTPPIIQGKGYKLSFSDDFNDPSTIDLNDTGESGYKWYRRNFFGSKTTAGGLNITVASGILTLGGKDQPGGNLKTAAPANNRNGWVGQVFRQGGYFEARLRFDPHVKTSTSVSWPAFWSMAIEHMAEKGADQWPGQPSGYAHFIEPDFFEYDTRWLPDNTAYGGAVHDWYGIYDKPVPGFSQVANYNKKSAFNNFLIAVPAGTDFATWHTFGCLWVPSVNGAEGYLQYTFDGETTSDRVTWTGAPQNPPPQEPWQFSIIDQQGLVVLLQTGKDWPMDVDWVRVWQVDKASANVVPSPGGPSKQE